MVSKPWSSDLPRHRPRRVVLRVDHELRALRHARRGGVREPEALIADDHSNLAVGGVRRVMPLNFICDYSHK